MSGTTSTAAPSGDIAIVGMSCRFPGEGHGVNGFWESISSGQSAWSQIPSDRFNPSAFWSPQKRANTSITRGGFFLQNTDLALFDAGFFTLQKAEAHAMDPQQRLLIEVAYEALESAGLPLAKIAGSRTGVYVGVYTHDYYEMLRKDAENMPQFTSHGTASTAMAGRLSWLWDLRGPSFALDTACSSGLVALHLAVQGLRTGESDCAIVGGTNLLISPDMFKVQSSASFLSPDGRSKAFDESADGYGRGEGIGCLVLKRVEDAIRDGDPIRAVIRGTGCNQDGHTLGMTLPNPEAQANLIRDTYRIARLDMADTGYVEAHGTGTQAGDREETTSLSLTIASAKKQARYGKLLIGSVKSNIGHLEAAAGIAAMIKTVLVLEHGVIPPTISAKILNPKIPFADWNLSVPTVLTPFPGSSVRRVSVNSFGFAGTNAHAIVDDAYSYLESRGIANGNHFTCHKYSNPVSMNDINGTTETTSLNEHYLLFALSAQDRNGVKRVRQGLAEYLGRQESHGDNFLVDLAYTLNKRRTQHQWKSYALASSVVELIEVLKGTDTPRPEYLSVSQPPRLGFVFTGQGAQWATMGMELMAYSTFASSVTAADKYLQTELGCLWSAEEELRRPKAQSNLGIAEYSQPLCTVLQIALVDLLREWGITPSAVTGHSSGEIAAAYCLGALTRENAWLVAYYRGVLSSGLNNTNGAMMAVGMSPESANQLIAKSAPGEVTVACINSPTSVTLSGDAVGIDRLLAILTEDGVFARKLQVDTAYHSHHMNAIASDYMDAILDIRPKTSNGRCIMQSSATGTAVVASELGPAHWVRNLVSPVQFSTAIQDIVRPRIGNTRATKNDIDILVEIGPHSALSGPSLQSLKAIGITDMPYLTALSRRENGIKTCLSLAGDLFTRSFPVDIIKANEYALSSSSSTYSPRALIGLPSYPWNHQQRYWAETRWAREHRMRQFAPLSLLGAPQPSPVAGEHAWRGYMRMREQPWVADHRIQGSILYPGAGFLAMAIEAAAQIADRSRKVRGFHLRHIQLVLPMVLQEDHDVEYSIILRPHLTGTLSTSSTWLEFVISSSPDGIAFERNCLGLVLVEYEGGQDPLEHATMRQRIDKVAAKCKIPLAPEAFYANLTSLGLTYGPQFQNVSSVRYRQGQSTAVVDVPNVGLEDVVRTGQRPHVVHPAMLDAVFHTIFAAALGNRELTTAMIPKTIESVFVSMDMPFHAGKQLSGVCEARSQGLKEYLADIFMEDYQTLRPVLMVRGLCCARVAGDVPAEQVFSKDSLCAKVAWRPHIDFLDSRKLAQAGLANKSSAVAKLSEMISLVHHLDPGVTITEFVTSKEIMLPKLNFGLEVSATATYQIACSENFKLGIEELLTQSPPGNGVKPQIVDAKQCLSTGKFPANIVIAVDDGSQESRCHIEALCEQLPVTGGRLCVIGRASSANTGIDALLHATKHLKTSFALEDEQYLVRVFTEVDRNTSKERSALEEVVILSMGPTPIETHLSRELETRGINPVVVLWTDIAAASAVRDRRCISLVELEKPLLEDLNEQDFSRLMSIVKNASHISWIVGKDDNKPGATMITGMLRVLHNEMPGLEPIAISVDVSSRSHPEQLGQVVAQIYVKPMGEREFHIVNCIPQVSRMIPDEQLNTTIAHLTGATDTQEPEVMSYGEATSCGSPLRLVVGKPGQLDSVLFQKDDAPEPPLLADEIEIEVMVSALNFRDVMSIMGLIPNPAFGFEAAGFVRRVGSAVSQFQISDRVALAGNDAHASAMRGKAAHAFKVPAGMTFQQAAALPVVSYTAWYGLVGLARAKRGQTVLIHAGAGGVGQAAIQLANHLGLEVFTTVSTDEKRQLLQDRYGVAKDHIFGSRDLGFARQVMEMTGDRGVDIVLNSLAGDILLKTWECLAPSGHFVEIGLKDLVDNTRLGMRPFMRGASFSSFNLKDIWDDQPELMAEIVKGTTPYLVAGHIRPAEPLVPYSLSDIIKALRLLQSGRHTGKLVLNWTAEAQIPVLPTPVPPLRLLDGVFLLVGGMGGLGRSIARMLVSYGAQKLCFLSRSASPSYEARLLLEELEEKGVQTRVFACNVSRTDSLSTALEQCKSELGPIRGVFQCAAVLRDALFTNMKYSDWTESTEAKVQGSRNLSDALPDVDFFILLSSFAAVFGNRGQANYAAGCAFQDALAEARRARGQSAVSIDLGVMRDVGMLAENGAQGDLKEWEKVWGIREDSFHALMRVSIQAHELGVGARIVTGLGTRAGSLAAGIKPPYYLDTDARFSMLSHVGSAGSGLATANSRASEAEQPLSALVPRAVTVQDAAALVLGALVGRVAKMLDLSPSDVDTGRILHTYGVDSLAAIEIVNWALRDVHSRIAVFDVMAAVSMAVFSERVALRSKLLPKALLEVN